MMRGGNSNISTSSGGNNRLLFPFTATQWQELEHQALIYKYMISGLPIPPDLLFSVKRSLDSSISSKLLLQQPAHHIGWNCFPMNFGRKIDPEPGRCRRTDGKKWRCSKEAYADSKYCERHMHRGRNRSRKPVELNLTNSTTNNNNNTNNNINNSLSSKPNVISSSITQSPTSNLFPPSSNNTYASSMTFDTTTTTLDNSYYDNNSTHLRHCFLHPQLSSTRSSTGLDFSSQVSRDKDHYRYGYDGIKGEIDEHPFFSESSGCVKDYSLSSSSSLAHLKQRTPDFQSGYPFLHLNDDDDSSSKQKTRGQYFHILDNHGFDREICMQPEREDKNHKVMHHFFDELPRNRDSWEDKSSNYLGASTTQLSISTPKSSYDFFMDK